MTGIQAFVARENIKHLHHELEGGADPIRRATMLKRLVGEGDLFDRTGDQWANWIGTFPAQPRSSRGRSS